MNDDERLALAPCPFCGNPPGEKVGPPAYARCITDGCHGKTLGAHTLAEWNAAASPAPGAGGEQTVVVERLQRCVEKLEGLETLPRPYDIYYAVKNEGQGTGWTYSCAGIGVLDLRVILDRLAAPPSNAFEAGLLRDASPALGYAQGFEACREAALNLSVKLRGLAGQSDTYLYGFEAGCEAMQDAIAALPAPAAVSYPEPASEHEAESAIRHLKLVIDAAENSNQSGENAVVRAALVTGWKRP